MALLVSLDGGCARVRGAAGPPIARDHLRARLVAEHAQLVPGAVNHLALLFDIDSGWHLYSPWRSDSGLPLALEPHAPEGFRFREPLWPAPERLVSPGSIVDHVYANRVAIILPLEVPAQTAAGRGVTLRCNADWLVCGTSCIPGSGVLEIELPVGAQGALAGDDRQGDSAWPADHRRLIKDSLERVPVPLDGQAPPFTVQWDAGRWKIEVPGATGLWFYPAERCASLLDPLNDTVSTSNRLFIRLPATATASESLVGVLEVAHPEGPDFYTLDVPVGSGFGGGAADRGDGATDQGSGGADQGDQARGTPKPAHEEDV